MVECPAEESFALRETSPAAILQPPPRPPLAPPGAPGAFGAPLPMGYARGIRGWLLTVWQWLARRLGRGPVFNTPPRGLE
jgi:hypothetical protein